MAKIILYSAMSLDGFIARSDGNIDWLSYQEYQLKDEDFGYKEFIKNVGSSIMGRKTYEQVKDEMPPQKPGDPQTYLLSRNPGEDNETLKYIREDFKDFLLQLKKTMDKDIWVVGGGEVDTLALETGLVDKMILTVFPLLLGDGIKLFEGKYGEYKFSLDNVQSYPNGFVQLEYSRLRKEATG